MKRFIFATLSSDRESSNRLIYDILLEHSKEIERLIIFYTKESKQLVTEIKDDIERIFVIKTDIIKIDAFDILTTATIIKKALKKYNDRKIPFNITLGTVPMTIGAILAGIYFDNVELLYYDINKKPLNFTGILKSTLESKTMFDLINIISESKQVTYKSLERETGLSKASISKYISRLKKYNLITIERKGYGGKAYIKLADAARLFE